MNLKSALQTFANEEICPVGEHCQPGFVAGAFWGWGEARCRVGKLLSQHAGESAGDAKFYILRAVAILTLQCAGIGPDVHDALSEAKESLEHACRLLDEGGGE